MTEAEAIKTLYPLPWRVGVSEDGDPQIIDALGRVLSPGEEQMAHALAHFIVDAVNKENS